MGSKRHLFIGKLVLQDWGVILDETGQVGPTSFAIGDSSNDGNACAQLVIRFVANWRHQWKR
jgi:hypothetical protein